MQSGAQVFGVSLGNTGYQVGSNPYQAIGLITVNYEKKDQWNLADETKLIDKVIGCARELGANGLILEVSQPQLNGPVSMRGTAIVLT